MAEDTIVAPATPLIPSAIGIVRLSGPTALSLADRVFRSRRGEQPSRFPPRQLVFGEIRDPRDGELLDRALCVVFRAPHSYTGEDLVEFHCHGSPTGLRRILRLLSRLGARYAEPGEFTRRAFLNGKMDLTQAEAVALLVEAQTERAHKAGLLLLEGGLSQKVRRLRSQILDLLASLEVVIDYADEDVEELPSAEVQRSLEALIAEHEALLSSYREGRRLREGALVVLVGKPNVGKSSLLNQLAGEERALVTPIPGTTRDYIETWISVEGIPVRLVDTAGLRESADYVEQLGTQRTRKLLRGADLVLFLLDASQPPQKEDFQIHEEIASLPHLVVLNKVDLGVHPEMEARFPGALRRSTTTASRGTPCFSASCASRRRFRASSTRR